jgi:hypothetical protein
MARIRTILSLSRQSRNTPKEQDAAVPVWNAGDESCVDIAIGSPDPLDPPLDFQGREHPVQWLVLDKRPYVAERYVGP